MSLFMLLFSWWLFSTFCLETKSGAKNSRLGDALRRPAWPTHNNQSLQVTILTALLPYAMPLYLYGFSKEFRLYDHSLVFAVL